MVLVVIFQWLSFMFGMALLLAIPILIGRDLFTRLNAFFLVPQNVPSSYKNPVLAARTELPTHDLYSAIAGLAISIFVFKVLNFAYYALGIPDILKRRNAIKRPRTGSTVIHERVTTFRERVEQFWQHQAGMRTKLLFKGLYLFLVVGVLIPITAGLLINFYALDSIYDRMNQRPIVFLLVDWSSGAILCRILYRILRLLPNHRIAQIVIREQNRGLIGADLGILTISVFLPILFCNSSLLSMPFFCRVIELHFGRIILIRFSSRHC